MTKGILVRIRGKVQGVGLRRYVVREAVTRNATGWVRNVSDGSVEIFLTNCTEDQAHELVSAVRQGPGTIETVTLESYADKPIGIGFHLAPTVTIKESTSL